MLKTKIKNIYLQYKNWNNILFIQYSIKYIFTINYF